MKLKITVAARAKILEAQALAGKGPLVAFIGWVSGGVKTHWNKQGKEISVPIQPHWGLGFYEKSSLPVEEVQDIDGIAVMKDESLNGKTVDFQEGEFCVR